MVKGKVRHRNSQKRFYIEGACYFITSVTYRRFPFFKESIFAELFLHDLWFGKELKDFSLCGYTVLPDHVHLVFQPLGKANMSDIVGMIKRNDSRDINDLRSEKNFIRNVGSDRSIYTNGGDDSNRRLQRNYQITRQVHPHLPYETYKRHFMILEALRLRFHQEHGTAADFPKFRWLKSSRDHIIRNLRDYDKHLEYIYYNAVKHKLVEDPEDWPWIWVEGMPDPSFLY